jgi:hypothetical protein
VLRYRTYTHTTHGLRSNLTPHRELKILDAVKTLRSEGIHVVNALCSYPLKITTATDMTKSNLFNPVFSELYNAAQESPELDRILGSMRRHMEKGTYDLDRVVKSVNRYVVETAAINLHRQKSQDTSVSWFTRYPASIRREVAEKVVSGWEREVKAEMGGGVTATQIET